jgi:hypothetical protein
MKRDQLNQVAAMIGGATIIVSTVVQLHPVGWSIAMPPAVAATAAEVRAMPSVEYVAFREVVGGVVYTAQMGVDVDADGVPRLWQRWQADGVAVELEDLPDDVAELGERWVAWSITTLIRSPRTLGGAPA